MSMEFKQLVMNETDTKYQEMSKGTTSAPLSQNVSVSDSNMYSQKRDDYFQRLSREKIAFNSAIKEIIKTRDNRLNREKQRRLEKQQNKEKAAVKAKLIFFWIVCISWIVVNLVLEKNVLGVCVYNELNDMDMFSGLWSTLWPAWIVIAVSLLTTAILGRKLLEGGDASLVCFIEVGALLVFTLVLAFVFPPCDTIIENIIGLPILCAFLYVVPVGVSGFISLAICAHYNRKKNEKTDWKCIFVGWKRTLISAIFVVVGLNMFSMDDSLAGAIDALLIGIGIYAYGVIKNIKRNK